LNKSFEISIDRSKAATCFDFRSSFSLDYQYLKVDLTLNTHLKLRVHIHLALALLNSALIAFLLINGAAKSPAKEYNNDAGDK
jgi:hypothetical protein